MPFGLCRLIKYSLRNNVTNGRVISQKDDLNSFLKKRLLKKVDVYIPKDGQNYVDLEKAKDIYRKTMDYFIDVINSLISIYLHTKEYVFTNDYILPRLYKTFKLFDRKTEHQIDKFVTKNDLAILIAKDLEYDIYDFLNNIYKDKQDLKRKFSYDVNSNLNNISNKKENNNYCLTVIERINSCINYMFDTKSTYISIIENNKLSLPSILYIFLCADRLILTYLLEDVEIKELPKMDDVLLSFANEIRKFNKNEITNFEIQELIQRYFCDFNVKLLSNVHFSKENAMKVLSNIKTFIYKSNRFLFDSVINVFNKLLNKDNIKDILINNNINNIEYFNKIRRLDKKYCSDISEFINKAKFIYQKDYCIDNEILKLEFNNKVSKFLNDNLYTFTFLSNMKQSKAIVSSIINSYLNLVDVSTISDGLIFSCICKILTEMYYIEFNKTLNI